MTGSIALDVVIGLVFIFLLYSLFASIIQEIISHLLGLRARNLRHAIERMLEDEKRSKPGDIVSRAFSDTKERLSRNMTAKKIGLSKEFYNQPVIKYLASGHYFSKPSYINGSDFTKAILGILKDEGGDLLKLGNNEASNLSTIDKVKSVLNNPESPIPDETKKHIASLLDDAQNDLVKFELNLEEWFNHTMERASGWYKRSVQTTLVIIGFILAVTFNADTIAIAGLLSKDKDARAAMVELASNYIAENEDIVSRYTAQKQDSLSEKDPAVEDFETKLDDLMAIKEELENDIDNANNILGFRPKDEIPAFKIKSEDELKDNQKLLGEFDGDTYAITVPSNLLEKNTYKYYELNTREISDEAVVYADFNYYKFIKENFWDNFWGYMITALAISLGAPFWFDLLSRLIRIRNSIQSNNPSAKVKSDKDQSSVSINQRVG